MDWRTDRPQIAIAACDYLIAMRLSGGVSRRSSICVCARPDRGRQFTARLGDGGIQFVDLALDRHLVRRAGARLPLVENRGPNGGLRPVLIRGPSTRLGAERPRIPEIISQNQHVIQVLPDELEQVRPLVGSSAHSYFDPECPPEFADCAPVLYNFADLVLSMVQPPWCIDATSLAAQIVRSQFTLP
jgi:hypothetical protein